VDTEALERDYLGRLEAAAWPLSPDRRAELVDEVREHIETALARAGRRDEVTVRNVLERLGPPEQIAAAEAGPRKPGAPVVTIAPPGRYSWIGATEIIALLLFTVGAIVLPIVGPLIGLVFMWVSGEWTTRDKAIGTAIVLVLLALPIVLLLVATAATASSPMVVTPVPPAAIPKQVSP
jgi:hypothetical protein